MKRLKIFLDSNVILAGLASTTGASAEILRLAEARVFKVYISRKVVKESQKNLQKKLPEFLPFFHFALRHLKPEIFRDVQKIDKDISLLLPKKSDQIIFVTAARIKVDYFLTLNRKHFHQPKVKQLSPFKILMPAEFLKVWRLR